MTRTLFLFLHLIAAASLCRAQDQTLWDGELANDPTCNKAYGSIMSGAGAHAGNFYFRAEPDAFHFPKIGFNCNNMWRSDISKFDELRFYIKCNVAGQTTSVRFTTYFAKSNWVDISPYIEGGSAELDYKEVRIPLSVLKTPSYNLSSIEYLEFYTSATPQLQFSVDDIKVADSSVPTVTCTPVSSKVLRLNISERFDTTDCHNILNYSLINTINQAQTHPVKVGRHQYVTSLTPGSGSPVVAFELFLIFENDFIDNTSYTLQTGSIKDLSGNIAPANPAFTFLDNDLRDNIKVNQVGYLPDSPKLAKLGNFLGDAWAMPVDTVNPHAFQLLDGSEQVVFNGTGKFLQTELAFSGESVIELDFSTFTTPGTYHVYVPGYGFSETFSIANEVYDGVYHDTFRALYYQRSGKLDAVYAGKWAREGLPDVTAEIHASQANSPLHSITDPAPGTKIPMPGGWLDAGDYGRYVPTAASALFILFTAYELYPSRFGDDQNIPESGNNIPDILDEIKYETDWLKHMQAPDGGVYFRVTPATWSAGLPGEENNTLYVSEKTTQSTAMFAAAMAMASRNLKNHFPAHADSCLAMAKLAWTFLEAHSAASAPVNVPGISAGPYPDPEDRDNRAWAAAELYKTTGEAIYNTAFLTLYAQIPHEFHATMSWQQHTVKAIWAYSTTQFPTEPAPVTEFKNKLNSEILVNYFNRTMLNHAYHAAYHQFKGYVGYGTFGMAQSYAFDYIMFSYLLKKPELLNYAKIQIDIPLGNNPLSRSFITGVGPRSPKLPLHWSTVYGKFDEPVPGVPVFGPAASLVMNRPSSFAIQSLDNRYPAGFTKEDPYPVLRRYTDAREAVEMAEFTVQEIAVTAATFAFFSSVNIPVPEPAAQAYYRLKATEPDSTMELRICQLSGEQFELQLNTSTETQNTTFPAQLYDLKGDRRQTVNIRGNNKARLDGRGLLPGIYILKIIKKDGSAAFTEKLCIY